jgi:hypothetical protein
MKSRPLLPRTGIRYFARYDWLYRVEGDKITFKKEAKRLWRVSSESLNRVETDEFVFKLISEAEARIEYPNFI